MSQHDYEIANQAGASARADINNALLAIVSQNSGATAPATTFAYQWWADTTTGLLKQRDSSNSSWITVCALSNWAMPSIQTQAATAFPTTGSAGAYIVTAVPAVTNTANTRLRLAFNFATTGACTLAANGQAALPLKQYDSGGNLVDPVIASGMLSDVESNGTNWIIYNQLPAVVQNSAVKNRFINGSMFIDQRNAGAAQTITAAAALAYTVDRWYGYCTGANVTGQQVAGTAPNKYNYRYTGAASVTKIGHAQRIEDVNSQDLAGTTATLSVDLANSLLTTVTWTAWYANTVNTFGTLASPTRTSIATGTFTVSSTLTRYSAAISIPAGATTGIEIEFSVGAQTSGTWTIGRAQLVSGAQTTAIESLSYGDELLLCQRYLPAFRSASTLEAISGSGMVLSTTSVQFVIPFMTPARVPPTNIVVRAVADFTVNPAGGGGVASAIAITDAGLSCSRISLTSASMTTGQAAQLIFNNASGFMYFTGAEL